MASQWNLPVTLIPMAVIESNLTGFLDVIKMTRCPQKFIRWQSKVVEKSFRWADSIHKLRQSIDSVQIDQAVSRVQSISVAFIDVKPINAVLFPYKTLLSAILSSPLLPLCHDRASMLQTCYEESSKRIGMDLTRKIFEEVSNATLCYRKLFDDMSLQHLSSRSHQDFSQDDHFSSLPLDDVLLACQLIEVCCKCKKKSEDGLISQSVIKKMETTIKTDSTILRLLCIGVTLNPCTLYCASSPSFGITTSFVSSSSTSFPSCLPFPSVPQIQIYPHLNEKLEHFIERNLQNDIITLVDFSKMIENEQLWTVIINHIQIDCNLFLQFDENFLIFQLLLERNQAFGQKIVDQLKISIFDDLEKIFNGPNDKNEGDY